MFIETLIEDILLNRINRMLFSNIVNKFWESKEFLFKHSDPIFLRDDIRHFSFDEKITEHGRIGEQPMSLSQHLFGDEDSLAARLTYDPPKEFSYIEYHTHPVDSLVVVIDGDCIYSVYYEDSQTLIDIPLELGMALFFPANTIHTIKKIQHKGLEMLNITDRLNQPNYRTRNSQLDNLITPSSDFSKPISDIKYKNVLFYSQFIES
jgi:mannose-6-phosphate isomerase-like protein (cupin superfamily)